MFPLGVGREKQQIRYIVEGFVIAGFSSLAEPVDGRVRLQRYALSSTVEIAEIILCLAETLFCRFLQQRQRADAVGSYGIVTLLENNRHPVECLRFTGFHTFLELRERAPRFRTHGGDRQRDGNSRDKRH